MFSTILGVLRQVISAIQGWIDQAEVSTGVPFWQITIAVVSLSIIIRILVGPMIGGFHYSLSDSAKPHRVDHLTFQGNKVYATNRRKK